MKSELQKAYNLWLGLGPKIGQYIFLRLLLIHNPDYLDRRSQEEER
jgi:hypothetical protein